MTERGEECSEEGCDLPALWALTVRGGGLLRMLCSSHAIGAIRVDHALLMVPRRAA